MLYIHLAIVVSLALFYPFSRVPTPKCTWSIALLPLGCVYMHCANGSCSCSGDVPNLTPDDFEKHMRQTLEEVRKHIPKLFVNLVLLGNISEVSFILTARLHAYFLARPCTNLTVLWLITTITQCQIYKLSLKSEHCSNIHRILPIECICAFAPGEEGDKLRFGTQFNLHS